MLRRLLSLPIAAAAICLLLSGAALADGDIKKVNHIIIVMQENHSYDNYFGALANNPTGPFPASCAAFDQLGVRVPMIAVSPFSKPSYVSHTIGDHTSLLSLIEKRFMNSSTTTVHLTRRDQYANDLEDLFDFDHSPSLNTTVGSAQPPQNDCTP